MKNKKRIIVAMIILVIIIIIVLICLIKLTLKGEEEEFALEGKSDILIIENEKKQKVNDEKLYFTVDKCMHNYFSIIQSKNKEVIISYLNNEYIKQNNITENNVLQFVGEYNDFDSYRTYEMFETIGNDYNEYYVKGKIDQKEKFFNIGVDFQNNTFDIIPIDESIYNSKINSTAKLDERTIQENLYNAIIYETINDEIMAKLYLEDYLSLMLKNSGDAYNIIDNEYRDNKFSTINSFYTFIKENEDNLKIAHKVKEMELSGNYDEYYNAKQKNYYELESYSTDKYNDYTKYICEDRHKRQYIFKVKSPGDYTVMLDSYTVPIPEFLDKYNAGNEQIKVGMNIQNIIAAINNKDYEYVYSKLNTTFKNNNFKDVNSLKEYIQSNLYEVNEAEYGDFSETGNNVYSYKVKLKSLEDENKYRDMNITMKLNSGTDFEMSFSIE